MELQKCSEPNFANSQLPQDVMHVVLEGVLNLETQLVLSSFVNDKKFFTLDFLNQRIAHFPYGSSEKRNKPPRKLKNANLCGSKMPLSGISFVQHTICIIACMHVNSF